MKKISIIISVFLLSFSWLHVFSATPELNCIGLPGCVSTDITKPVGTGEVSKNIGTELIGNVISEGIKYVAVIAVIALMISGVLYLVSEGEEEKVKRAKTWIIWSLAGVFISISAWSIISLLNNLTI